ncbi:hypothetical protein GIB67_039655 [Kingdonia uniflora]|uniref:EF-hand domain-containing protein n=1 Tax=Kingdonia uniflora TaxID=39325 RepID=A0A7J7MDX7_9MAGN|nr:hypothetical protein GIB67_039655 [Kingdonia uniflora]
MPQVRPLKAGGRRLDLVKIKAGTVNRFSRKNAVNLRTPPKSILGRERTERDTKNSFDDILMEDSPDQGSLPASLGMADEFANLRDWSMAGRGGGGGGGWATKGDIRDPGFQPVVDIFSVADMPDKIAPDSVSGGDNAFPNPGIRRLNQDSQNRFLRGELFNQLTHILHQHLHTTGDWKNMAAYTSSGLFGYATTPKVKRQPATYAPPVCVGGANPFSSLLPSSFPPGMDQNAIACFKAADLDGNGFIDDKELKRALSSCNHNFSIRTVRLLMSVFTNTNTRIVGPREFASVFNGLQNWRAIFERYDRNGNGKVDSLELREALQYLGFTVSPTVLNLLISRFDKTGGKNMAIEYDNFIECCITVKGLTEKFKEKDNCGTGSATFTYETFMLIILPFITA